MALLAGFTLQLTGIEPIMVAGQWVGNAAVVTLVISLAAGTRKRWPNPFALVIWILAGLLMAIALGVFLTGANLYAQVAIRIYGDTGAANLFVETFTYGVGHDWGFLNMVIRPVSAFLLYITNSLRMSWAVFLSQLLYLGVTLLEIGPIIIKGSPTLSEKKALWLGSRKHMTARSSAGRYEQQAFKDVNEAGEGIFRSLSTSQRIAYLIDAIVIGVQLSGGIFAVNPNSITFDPAKHIEWSILAGAVVLLGGMAVFTKFVMFAIRAYEVTLQPTEAEQRNSRATT